MGHVLQNTSDDLHYNDIEPGQRYVFASKNLAHLEISS